MKPALRKVQVIPSRESGNKLPVSPAGRVDILLHRLAEECAKQIEFKFNMPGIWNALKPIADEKVKEYEGMGPVEFARHIGFLKSPKRRRRIA